MSVTSFSGQYRFLSNFMSPPIPWEGLVFATVEHAFQWTKMDTEAGRMAVAGATSPGNAKRVAKEHPMRFDWDFVKVDVMRELLRLKFSDQFYADWLLATDGDLIEGNSWGDTFWGVCNGVGQNNLGKLLMELRNELRAAQRNKGIPA